MAFEIPMLKQKAAQKEEREPEARPMPGVMVALDNYDDIFSDFDTRPYAERGLSDDFLKELARRTLEKPGGESEVLLVLPKLLRKEKDEALIKSRLRKHFSQTYKGIVAGREEQRRQGALYFVLGAGLLVAEVLLVELPHDVAPLVFALAQAMALPAGWFLAYTGLEKMLQPYGNDREQYDFARKMQGASYRFTSYEELEDDARRELDRLEKVTREVRERVEVLERQQAEKAAKARGEPRQEAKGEEKEKKEEKK